MNKLHTGSVYPWQTELERFIEQVESAPNRENDEWTHERKLAVLEKLVRAYASYQDDNGAIIDPHSESERYYSTPSYALAAAVLVKKGRHDLLESAAAALTHSIVCVVEEKAPDHHPDFFPIMVMGAYRILKNLLPEQAMAWKQQLSRIQPEQAYIFTMNKMKNPNRMINWNAIMISGEFLRAEEGIAADSEWMETYIRNYHLPRFTGLGLYQDGPLDRPNSPFAYDIVTRFHLGVMLESGYNGGCASEVRDYLRRGALSSLLTLSPHGEIPPRGRSAQHQWNEAAAAFVFTTHAQQAYTSGEYGLAGAFRRAADLCWQSIDRWQNDDGKLHIVRNYYSSEARHGFEVYSNHTCYSLWTAAALAYTLLHGKEIDRIPPTFIPAEIGSRVLATDGWFQTVIAAVDGQQMLVQTSINDPYNIPGIVRIQRSALPSLIGPSSAGHADRGFTGFAEGDIFPLSYTPAWQTEDGKWHSLSEGIPGTLEFDRDGGIDPQDGGGNVQLEHSSASAGETDFTLLWEGPFPGVREIRTHYRQVPGKIEVSYELQGNIQHVGALIPLMAYDGQERSVIHHVMAAGEETESIRVEYAGASLEVIPTTEGTNVVWPEELTSVACRNGLLKGARLECGGSSISFIIRLAD
ncbi:glycosyl hydrolase [Paenibacillus sp. CMAA1739]|uniref:glycosyl hydrolase n=1 Tax=Paenibacillus ottowii TaxID=2315729 RepID=UPI0027322152|nr:MULTISPECIES: glycosyl hydrolase [Paenibacillus]MDP1510782.1 glycosyl hydrolase [Paenibacillus ottowii]MEC4566722.1 glycosyl hydrolase [Paenibacillus sp. CMAA1739]